MTAVFVWGRDCLLKITNSEIATESLGVVESVPKMSFLEGNPVQVGLVTNEKYRLGT